VLGASLSELGFVAVLVALVLLAQVAPRVGEAIGARFGGPTPPPGEKGP
jgi:Flp pilus assembly pilin Flp